MLTMFSSATKDGMPADSSLPLGKFCFDEIAETPDHYRFFRHNFPSSSKEGSSYLRLE